ncbi:MaoC family dehydratase [Gordonia polyisoprenivorans]|uniref:MaoC family dehydratase n=1 Tax=Gordonia polyisoprenivorans TaxID=84595 RepID=UPI001AD71328|nr:MaoC family dehydratase [Gordonia polyisoprenivorans]QTI69051.1 MaoC family dehydratase [Gordonia polyisoprenivorans]
MKVFDSLDEFAGSTGQELGTSDWVTVDQVRIDKFADATGDHQWIHVDPDAAAQGPFGTTIAHGFLTLSLLPVLWHQLYTVEGVRLAVNYGLGKVRFISPVPAGAKVRASARVVEVTKLEAGVQATLSTTIEIDGIDKPAAVVESIVRYVA